MDSGWIKALELPAQITGGVFAACCLVYLLNETGQLALADVGEWALPVIIIAGILSGCLFVGAILAYFWRKFEKWREQREKKVQKDEVQKTALAYLDTLSEQENYMVCKALKEGSPSFTSWLHISAAAQLVDKGLLIQHTGVFNREHWPYTFHDFAWKEIERRKDEFLQKETDAKPVRRRQ